MRILMEQGGHSFRNVGDWAMLRVAVNRVRTLFPGCQISVLVDDPARIAECMPDVEPLTVESREMTTGSGCLFGRWSGRMGEIDRKLVWAQPGWVLPFVGRRPRRRGRAGVSDFISAIQSADLVMASGGGYITDAFPAMVEGICGMLAVAQRLGKQTAMFGQGLGPLDDRRLHALAQAGLAKVQMMTLREELKSPAVASSLGIPRDRIAITGDDAIELAYALRPVGLGSKLGVNLRSTAYSAVTASDTDQLRAVIQRITRDLGVEPQVLPISFFSDGDITSTAALLDPSQVGSLPQLEEPEDVIRLAGQCRVVITGSYHAGVFALAQGIPVVGLVKSAYYRDKFDGLASQFGEGCVCLPMNSRDFPEQLHATTLRLAADAERLRPILLERAEDQIARGQAAYGRLPEMLCLA